MKTILLTGAGKIGATITELLIATGDYHVTVADANPNSLDAIADNSAVVKCCIDITKQTDLLQLMVGKFAVINAGPYFLTHHVAGAAATANSHYLDLTEDITSTQQVRALAQNSRRAFIPQCGLAPGFISIVTNHLTRQFDSLQNVHMRVGALPKYPTNTLKYNLTWSTEGLINEYCQPCEAIVDGKLVQVSPLEDIEHFSLDGINYEAFNTSGGLGTLCETLLGKVGNLNYRTVRYPGHRDVMKMLLQDLRLRERPELIKDILETALPVTYQDVVLIFVNVSGMDKGQLVQSAYANKLYNQTINGRLYSAIQCATASSVCAVLDLLATGIIPARGFIKQESIDFNGFIENRFGSYYALPEERAAGAVLPLKSVIAE